jgi:hypothetical protein
MTGVRLAVALLLAGASLAAQSPDAADETRAAWRYRREVAVPADAGGGFVAIAVPPEVAARGRGRLDDLRLIGADGGEVPYVLIEDRGRQVERRVGAALSEAARERGVAASWTGDFGGAVTFDRLELAVDARDFSKRVMVETSSDGTTWLRAADDIWLFERTWQGRPVQGTAIEVPATTARYARITADDTRSPRVEITGMTAVLTRRIEGSRWQVPAELTLERRVDGRSRYRVAIPDGFPLRRLEIDADDAAFARPVQILAQADGDQTVGQSTVYRLALPDADVSVEERGVEVQRPTRGALVVEIDDGDSPPLRNPRVVLSGPQTQLVAALAAGTAYLYYGNPVARRMAYDVERLRPSLAAAPDLAAATLGGELENPRFRAPEPLTFLPAHGAVLAAGDWSYTRPFRIEGADDLYAMTLAPDDLARARADLADLRVVDAGGRQVPYIVEHGVETVSVPLTMTPASPRPGRPGSTAVGVSLMANGSGERLRLTALELQVGEGYFRRRVNLLQRDPAAPQGLRVVGGATVNAGNRESGSEGALVRVPLTGVTAGEVIIEIENGDNAPLTVRSVTGVTPVPRLTFKAGPGDYRLLLGNPATGPPSYEIDTLRRDVLDYTAVPIPAAWLAGAAANPDHQRSVADVVREAPPTLVLWSALGIAVVVLLLLTRRILAAPRGDSRS